MNFVKPDAPQTTCTLIHISDFHLCQPRGSFPHRFFNKRLFSYLSWRIRRRRQHCPEILAALTRAVQSAHPDCVAVTGDLTQLALPSEFDRALSVLQAIGPPQKVLVVPGNHDALVNASWPDSYSRWSDYMASDAVASEKPVEYPVLRIHGHVALIGLCSAHPTPILSAAGSMGVRQLQRLAEILDATADRRLFRVVLIHHPPKPDMVSFHKRLKDADAFGRLVKRYGVELILHGHAHVCSRAEIEGPAGAIPMLGVSSASASSRHPRRRAAFRAIRIMRSPQGWRTFWQEHAYSEKAQRFITLAPEGRMTPLKT
jgi:3',5'-cyclic AMP phosphodiesterase CpdA